MQSRARIVSAIAMLRKFVRADQISKQCGEARRALGNSTTTTQDVNVQIADFRTATSAGSNDPSRPRPRRVLITCEHAGNTLPTGFAWHSSQLTCGDEDVAASFDEQAAEGWPQETHWAYDPGAKDLSLELADELESVAVLSRVSRLFIDVNRPPGSDTLCRKHAEGRRIGLNADMSPEDRMWRVRHYWLPYHMALGRMAKELDPDDIVSIHSFTDNYEGTLRPFHVGVLCTSGESNSARALAVAAALEDGGFSVRMNEPWSGDDGFMYSADSLKISSQPGRRAAIMLEVRNDVLQNAGFREDMIRCLRPILALPVCDK